MASGAKRNSDLRKRGGLMPRSSGFTHSGISSYHGKPRKRVFDERRRNGEVRIIKPATPTKENLSQENVTPKKDGK